MFDAGTNARSIHVGQAKLNVLLRSIKTQLGSFGAALRYKRLRVRKLQS